MKATKFAAAQGDIHGGMHLDGLARRLRQWRARRGSKGPLPQWVWAGAAEAAREHGVSRVARVLHLDYDKLKRRLAALSSDSEPRRNGAPPGFVELNLSPTPSMTSEWTLELSDSQGRKLTLRGPSEPSCWGEVARAFWPEGA